MVSAAPSLDAMDIDTPQASTSVNSTEMRTQAALSIPSRDSSNQSSTQPSQKSTKIVESEPPPVRKQLSPIIERFGTSRIGAGAVKAKSLGMKGPMPSLAAAKPFKTPLPATQKRAVEPSAPRTPVRREAPPGNAGDLSSDSFDTSFGIDMDSLEEHLKAYD